MKNIPTESLEKLQNTRVIPKFEFIYFSRHIQNVNRIVLNDRNTLSYLKKYAEKKTLTDF